MLCHAILAGFCLLGHSADDGLLGARWDFEDGSLDGWRHKDNSVLSIADEAGGKCLRFQGEFSRFKFCWTTRQFSPRTLAGVRHVTFRVCGDGSGHRLEMNLGAKRPDKPGSLYYGNSRQAVTLDFTGWRSVSLDLDAFQTPPHGLRERDLAAVVFFQFFVTAQSDRPLDARIDDVQFTGPTPAEIKAAEELLRRREEILARSAARLAAARQGIAAIAGKLDAEEKRGEFTAVARVYLAALEWCADDVARTLAAEEFEIVARAPGLLESLERRIGQPQGILDRVAAKAPEEADTLDSARNPYFAKLVQEATGLSRRERTWAKGRAGYASIPDAWTFASLGTSVYRAAWTMTRPRSPLRHNPMLLRSALSLVDTIAHQHAEGDFNIDRTAVHGRDPNINRFCLAPTLNGWWELGQAYPELLPAPWREELENGLRRLADYQVEDYGTPRLERAAHEKHPAYPNMDVHYILIMELAQRIWLDPRYAAERDRFVKILDGATYPGGAWAYINTQNECFVYHQLNVVLSARHWQLSGNPTTLAMLRRTIPFYPYNVEPAGMPEYYTDACWKHYWGGGTSAGPDVIAGLFDDALNKQVADTAIAIWGAVGGYSGAIAAEFWKPIAPRPLPTGYTMFDANIQGPRGRYGPWSFGANGRDYGVGYQGKDTFVGAMLTDAARRPMPLDSALQIVTAEVRLSREGNHWAQGRCCSARERLTTAMGPDFGSLAVRYTVSKPNWKHVEDDLLPWDGMQQWYLSRERLVGLVALEATADETRAGVWGRIRLGLAREIAAAGANTWNYGRMRVTVHEHDYARIETRPSETFYLDKPESYRSTEITLLDPRSAAAGAASSVRYPKGTRYGFLVEIRPESSAPAGQVRRIDQSGIVGFHFQEGSRRVMVVHNTTDRPAAIDLPAEFASAALYDRAEPKPRAEAGTRLELKAHAHATLFK